MINYTFDGLVGKIDRFDDLQVEICDSPPGGYLDSSRLRRQSRSAIQSAVHARR